MCLAIYSSHVSKFSKFDNIFLGERGNPCVKRENGGVGSVRTMRLENVMTSCCLDGNNFEMR
jgi:hypothetical protein